MTITSTINSEPTRDYHHKFIDELFDKHRWFQATYNFDKGRTIKQNSSLHLYCSKVSKAFNDAGLDMVQILSHHADIPWDEKGFNVKERIWKPIQYSQNQQESTAKGSTKDYPKIYEIMNRYTAEKHGIHVPWPHKDSQQ